MRATCFVFLFLCVFDRGICGPSDRMQHARGPCYATGGQAVSAVSYDMLLVWLLRLYQPYFSGAISVYWYLKQSQNIELIYDAGGPPWCSGCRLKNLSRIGMH